MAAVSLDSFMRGDDLDLSAPQPAAPAEIKTVLVVGSQQAAADGSYQALVTELGAKGAVEMHMHDRITQGGEFALLSCSPGRPSSARRGGLSWEFAHVQEEQGCR